MKRLHAVHGPDTKPTGRRGFILLLPLASPWLLAACSKKEDTGAMPSTQTAPAPAPYTPPPPATSSTPGSEAPPATAAGSGPAANPATTTTTTTTTTTAAAPVVDETETIAQNLGYVTDARRADKVRFPAYRDGMACSNCSLFAGKSGDAAGACPLFANRQVSAKGWCSAYVKKAG